MKRTLFALTLCLAVFFTMIPNASAASELPLVMDTAWLMSSEDVASLEEKAQALRQEYEMDIVILTVDRLDGKTPERYADDYYAQNGYGYGANYSGVLFLLSMEERDWYISACGDAIYALTDYGIQASAEEALPYLSEGDYYNGFCVWLDTLPVFFDAYLSGAPIDGYSDDSGNHYHGTQESIYYYKEPSSPSIFLSLVIGLAAAGITILIMRASMNTKRRQHSAGSYLAAGSFHLRSHQDIFLYSNISKTARPKNTGSGGGSSVHHSAGGRSHGGGGGKF